MIIECATCPVREQRCDDCVVTVLHGLPVIPAQPSGVPLDPAEQRAVAAFVAAGLLDRAHAGRLRAQREPTRRASAVG